MKKKVAVFPAGSEIGLEINRALKYSMYIELFGFSSVNDHAKFVYKNYIGDIPFYNDENFIEVINYHIEENQIDFIFPAHDDVQLYLTENKEKINADILTSDLETVKICRSKIKTYKYFAEFDFIPQYYEKDNINEINLEFPLFIKPDIGQGSKGARKVNSLSELLDEINKDPEIVICEYLPGEEYTIDCFTDSNGKLRVCNARNRNRIKLGISVNSKILETDDSITNIANIINEKLRFDGAWFFQLKKDVNNQYRLMEIAPRVSGTMGLSRNTGVNYPLLTIFNKMVDEVKIIKNNYDIEVDRAFFSRYKINIQYDYVYVDLDDTLIIDGKVNNYLMMFLYQAVNLEKEIILITKHINNVKETLSNHKISIGLFDKVIHLRKEDEKNIHIESEKSIFIDDSFSERLRMFEEKNIPVFDTSEIESLLEWRG